MKQLIGDYEAIIENVNIGLQQAGIDKSELAMIDHLCYRVETDERYQELLHEIGRHAFLLGEAMIGGRPIATFEFNEPLAAAGWRIPYLEVPAPKAGSPYDEGLEHCELVVIGDLEKFARRHNDLSFDRKGMDKLLNPELGLRTAFMTVKFHEQPLGAIVRIEQRLAADSQGR